MRRAGHLVRRLSQAASALVVVAACLATLLLWRLSRGPLELPWAAHWMEAAINARGAAHVSIGGLSVQWSGFRDGADASLMVRLARVALTDPAGTAHAELDEVDVAFATAPLLLARLAPRSIEISGARVDATREADGQAPWAPGGFGGGLDGASGSDPGPVRWDQLRAVGLRDAALTVTDHLLGVDWRVAPAEVGLSRGADGVIAGKAHATLRLGGQEVDVDVTAADAAGAIAFRVSSFNPARLSTLLPALAPLAALDAPVRLDGHAEIGPNLVPGHVSATVEVGAGEAHIAAGVLPLIAATLLMDGTPSRLDATLRRLELAARPDGARTLIQAHLLATRGGGRVGADLTLELDQVTFADLPFLWPTGVGGKGTKPWIGANITAGVARNGHVAARLEAAEDLSRVELRAINVALDAHDVTVHWLRPVPPIEHIDGHLSMTGPEALDIAVTSGREAGGAMALRNGRVRLTGLAAKDQFADIEADLAGPLADVVTLLKHPRLKLLDKSPAPLRDVAGQLSGHLTLAHLPLDDKVSLDDIQIKAQAHATGVHLGALVAGRDLDRGTLDLEVTNDGLGVRGAATVAAMPAQFTFDMDFRAGPPTQVVEKVTVAATVDEQGFAGLGLSAGPMLSGAMPVRLDARIQRGGRGEVSAHADLSQAAVRVEPVDYRKPAGGAASAEARIVLDHDRVAQVDQVRIVGPGVDIQGRADFEGGRPNVLRLESVRLGDTNLGGEVRLPAKPGDAYVVRLAGASLDASGFLGDSPSKPKPKNDAPATGPAYTVDARIARVRMADRSDVTGLVASVEHDGRILRQAHVEGSLGDRTPFVVDVRPEGNGRRLRARTADAGALLRAAGLLNDVRGGLLVLSGLWDDRTSRHVLTGQLEVDAFTLRNVPAFGKILQAMTLYGLVDVVTTGPGLNFTRMVVPFQMASGRVELTDARAFSASLGMTAKGSIDLDRRVASVRGTVVPAYYINTLLGNVPLIGHIFSPEKGGGLFAATYAVTGSLDNPGVSVNPLAALTPGFLRGLFEEFQGNTATVAQGAPDSGGNR